MTNTLSVFRFTLTYAEKLVADIDDAEMTVLPHPGMNHPAWILGHVALGSDLVARLLNHPMLTDKAWAAKFGPGSSSLDDRERYPSKSDLLDMLHQTHDHAVKLIEAAPDEAMQSTNETPFFPDVFPTVGDLIAHLISTHPATHLGQLSAWRRCVGKDAVLGV